MCQQIYKTPWRRHLFGLACIVALGTLLRCWNIHQSFWWDELWSTLPYARADSLWHTVSSLGYYFNNHILYSLLCRAALQAFGESEVVARLPALLMGLMGIVALYHLAMRFTGSSIAALSAALLLAVSAFHIDHSSEARGYSGLALCALLSSLFFLDALKTSSKSSWIQYGLWTAVGFYMHVFMSAVAMTQVVSVLLFYAGHRTGLATFIMPPSAPRKFSLSLAAAGLAVLVLYAPILKAFLRNVGKVRMVAVTRLPFVTDLLDACFNGITSLPGAILYTVLFLAGLRLMQRRNSQLLVYTILILFLPAPLYLAVNPMFVYERYFIFALPFALLTIACGIAALPEIAGFRKAARPLLVALTILALVALHIPRVRDTITRDRQNYREAAQYVAQATAGKDAVLVFSIGYAGQSFPYYAGSSMALPATLEELMRLMEGKKNIWCLITAWLPLIRPDYEDRDFYAEDPEQEKIYSYVVSSFALEQEYPTKFPTRIYHLER